MQTRSNLTPNFGDSASNSTPFLGNCFTNVSQIFLIKVLETPPPKHSKKIPSTTNWHLCKEIRLYNSFTFMPMGDNHEELQTLI